MIRAGLIVWCLGVFAGLAVALPQARANDVPQVVQDDVEDALGRFLILPEGAIWRFDSKEPYPGGGTLVCGSVNYQTAERKYAGPHQFFAILDKHKVTTSQIEQPLSTDPTGQLAAKLQLLCGSPK